MLFIGVRSGGLGGGGGHPPTFVTLAYELSCGLQLDYLKGTCMINAIVDIFIGL